MKLTWLLAVLALPFSSFAANIVAKNPFSPKVAAASDEAENAIKLFKPAPGLKVELFAAEPLLANPVCFTIDEQGRFYVAETFRLHAGVSDIRGRVAWEDPAITKKLGHDVVADYLLNEELASKTVEESIDFLKRHFGDRAAKLSGESERVRMIVPGADGKAASATVFAEGFDKIGDGIGAGLVTRGGRVWFTCIPDLWMLQDTKGTGTADVKKALHHGYGVRVGFLGHDMHGLRFGPDGKLYFSIGDRGANVKTADGKHIYNPESGAVFRCNADGTDLELFATGLRNPQELVFDQFGNLWTGDNNSDAGDPARWVYVVENGDSGWRVGYQFIERPQARGPWLGERLCYPQWDGQAAYIVPPIDTIGSGPSGLAYYPGIGLSEKYNEHFFLCDFRGGAGNSGVHSFAVRPKGAGFETYDKGQFIWNILVTDVEFGYDGCAYVSDWVNGWGMPGKGRLYRVFDPVGVKDSIVSETKKMFAEGFGKRPTKELVTLLAHRDMRVRQEAQFALAEHGTASIKSFTEVLSTQNQLARLHAIWGLGQIAAASKKGNAANDNVVSALLPLLASPDSEVRAQAAKVLGDAHAEKAYDKLLALLTDTTPRVRFFALQSLGKLGRKATVPHLFTLLRENADKDVFIRHAAVMALLGCQDLSAFQAAEKDASSSVRMAVLLAYRRLENPDIANFLNDSDPKIVVEAARAINDASIYAALPKLAALISQPSKSEPLLKRVVNANLRLGSAENAQSLARFALRKDDVSEAVRVEALQALAEWAKPSPRDRMTGLYRPMSERDGKAAAMALQPVLKDLLHNAPDKVRTEAAALAGQYALADAGPALFEIVSDKKANVKTRVESLKSLAALKDAKLSEAVALAAADTNEALRKEATTLQSKSGAAGGATAPLVAALEKGTLGEKQNALTQLGDAKDNAADAVISKQLDALLAGKLVKELQLDVLDAAAKRGAADIKAKLEKFEAARPKGDALAAFREVMFGGNAEEGKKIFTERAEASCIKCHRAGDEGGDVGPVLVGIGGKQPREYLLESIVFPNAKIAPGFETLIVTMKNGGKFAGLVKTDNATDLVLNSPEDGLIKLKQADVAKRERGQSPMPEELWKVLSKRDLRDLVEFLANLK